MKLKKQQLIIISMVCITAAICIAAVCFVFFFNPQRTFIITETYRITASNNAETYLSVTLPMSSGYQEIGNLLVEGAEEYTVKYFDGWRELTARIPARDDEVIVTISYTATLFRNVQPWVGEVLDEYTLPQQFVDSDNESIIALAAQLRGDNDQQTAQNIHNHVYRLISWPSGERINISQLYASELLESPVGVCGDFAILMTALLRAENIPVRMISGLAFNIPLRRARDWGHQGASHAWVEFYADGKWHFADPSWGWFDRNATSHLSFGTYQSDGLSDFQQNRANAIEDAGFFLRGGMTAPLRFMLYSTDENAAVIPRGAVSFSWFR